MLCKVIATPCAYGKGDYNGWKFTQDNGRPLESGEVRFTYNPVMRDRIKSILTRAKRDYEHDRALYYKKYKASKQSLESTVAERAWLKEREKFLREGRTLEYKSL